MKKILPLILFIAFVPTTFLFSQEIAWGDVVKKGKDSYEQFIAENKDGGIITYLRAKDKDGEMSHMVRSYGADMKLITEKEIAFQNEGRTFKYRSTKEVGGGVYMLFVHVNVDRRIAVLYAHKLDQKTLDVKKGVKIREFKMVPEEYSRMYGKIEVEVSPDKNWLLAVFVDEDIDKETEPSSYQMVVMDGNMSLAWDKDIHFPKVKYSDIREIDYWRIDNNGKVYLFSNQSIPRKELENKKWNYNEHFITCYAQGKQIREHRLYGEEHYLSFIPVVTDAGKVVCAGFYGTAGSGFGNEGVFFTSIEENSPQNITNLSKQPLPESFIKLFNKRKGDKESRRQNWMGTTLTEVFPKEDGGVYLVKEFFHIHTQTSNPPGFMSSSTWTTHYSYGNIAVVSLKPDGTIDWNTKVSRPVRSLKDITGLLTAFILEGNNIHMLYNFWVQKESNKTENPEDAVLKRVTVNQNGKVSERQVAGVAERKGFDFSPAYFEQLSNGKFVLYKEMEKANEHHFGILSD